MQGAWSGWIELSSFGIIDGMTSACSRKLAYVTKWERNCVKNAFARAGFSRTDDQGVWNAKWGKHPSHREISELNRFQVSRAVCM